MFGDILADSRAYVQRSRGVCCGLKEDRLSPTLLTYVRWGSLPSGRVGLPRVTEGQMCSPA